MRQERLCGCDPTLGSGLSPELSGVPVGANQSLLKGVGCGGNFSQVEGGSSETKAVPQPLCVLQVQQSLSCLSHSVA